MINIYIKRPLIMFCDAKKRYPLQSFIFIENVINKIIFYKRADYMYLYPYSFALEGINQSASSVGL